MEAWRVPSPDSAPKFTLAPNSCADYTTSPNERARRTGTTILSHITQSNALFVATNNALALAGRARDSLERYAPARRSTASAPIFMLADPPARALKKHGLLVSLLGYAIHSDHRLSIYSICGWSAVLNGLVPFRCLTCVCHANTLNIPVQLKIRTHTSCTAT